MILTFRNVYLTETSTVAGPYEAKGPLKHNFDKRYTKDLYCGAKSFEKAETKLLSDSLKILLRKANMPKEEIDLIIAGDLLNQITASTYGSLELNTPFLGIYTACATSIEGMLIAATFIDAGKANNIISACSSHNMTSEKQFRNPTEYGSPKPMTATFTSTGAASVLLTNKPSKIKVVNGLIGTIIDYKQKDVFNMGAVMAPAAMDTLYRYLKETKTNLVYVSRQEDGKKSITNYSVMKTSKHYSMLKVTIETGRKNQIRVAFASKKIPIVGDKKYGNKDGANRLFLHANRLKIYYPVIKKDILFETSIPNEFKKLIGNDK